MPPVQNLSDSEKWALLAQANANRAADDLKNKSNEMTGDIAGDLGAAYMVEVVAQLRSDAGAELVRSLPADFGKKVIEGLPAVKRSGIRKILSYPDGCAGSMMAVETLYIPQGMTVADAIEYLHLSPYDKTGRHPHVYVVGEGRKLVGFIETQDLVLNSLDTPIDSFMNKDLVALKATTPKIDVARIMQADRHLGLPVVDDRGKLLGMILADSAIQAVQEKADTDIAHMVGTGAEEMRSVSIPKIMKLRLPWLMFSIASGLFCAAVCGFFEHGGRAMTVLFLFIPVVLGLSESIGIQGATIVVRRLMLGGLPLKEIGRLYVKEIVVGLLIGIICSSIVGVVTASWQGLPVLGVAIAASLMVAIMVSAVIGLSLPLLFKALKVDPAMASGPLVLAICDIQTLFVYFIIANAILSAR